MADRPALLILDVNETLADVGALLEHPRLRGAPRELLDAWFAATLRDGIALAAAGGYAAFAEVGQAGLTAALMRSGRSQAQAASDAEAILDGFGALPLHADVRPGLTALRAQGLRLVTLTNGSAAITEELLASEDLLSLVERRLSVEQAGRWKPAPEAYRYALDQCGVSAEEAMLVAVHPWDIEGAASCGLRTAWINRTALPYPGFLRPPDLVAEDLVALADSLAGR
jgi:2-haloacid dehalogenase